MKLTVTKDPDDIKDVDPKNLLVSKKYDGWLTQAIKSGGDWHIYTRRGQNVTDNMPKMVSALNNLSAPDNTFLLGEMVAKKDGKDDIGATQSVMGAKSEKGAEAEKGTDITFYVFDILWKGGNKVADKPFSERLKTLGSVVKDSGSVKKVPNKPFSSWQSVMTEATKTGGEGIVLKDTTKPYAYKTALGSSEPKPGYWFKYKGKVGGKEGKEDSDDYVVYAHMTGDKGKDKFKFGQYYKGKLYGISEISNLSEEDAGKLKSALSSGKKPVVELGFQERVPGGLRHQKFKRFREDKSSKNATMHEFHAKNIDKFKLASGKEQNADDDVIMEKLRNMVEPEVIDAGDSWEFQLFLKSIPITPRQVISKTQLHDFVMTMKELGEIAFQDVVRGHYDEEIMKIYEEHPELQGQIKVARRLSKRAETSTLMNEEEFIWTKIDMVDQGMFNNPIEVFEQIKKEHPNMSDEQKRFIDKRIQYFKEHFPKDVWRTDVQKKIELPKIGKWFSPEIKKEILQNYKKLLEQGKIDEGLISFWNNANKYPFIVGVYGCDGHNEDGKKVSGYASFMIDKNIFSITFEKFRKLWENGVLSDIDVSMTKQWIDEMKEFYPETTDEELQQLPITISLYWTYDDRERAKDAILSVLGDIYKNIWPISKRADFTINDTGFGNMIYNYADDFDQGQKYYLQIGHQPGNVDIWWMEDGQIKTREVGEEGHDNINLDKSPLCGRIDHDNKRISIAETRTQYSDRLLNRIVNRFAKAKPDYEIWYFPYDELAPRKGGRLFADDGSKKRPKLKMREEFEDLSKSQQKTILHNLYLSRRFDDDSMESMLNYLLERDDYDFTELMGLIRKRLFHLRTRVPQNKFDVGPVHVKIFWDRETERPWSSKDARQVKNFIKMLDVAIRRMMQLGLEKAIEGLNVYITMDQIEQDLSAARYSPDIDVLIIPYKTIIEAEEKPKTIIFAIFHEIGHRIYFKLMGLQDQHEWERRFGLKIINENDAKAFFDNCIRPHIGTLLFTKDLVEDIQTNPNINDVEREKFLRIARYFGSGDNVIPLVEDETLSKIIHFLQESYSPFERNEMIGEEITPYSAAHPREAFAEAFALYVGMGPNALGPWTRSFLKNVLSSAKDVQLVEDEDKELQSIAMTLTPKPAVYDGASDLSYEDRGRQWADDGSFVGFHPSYFDIGHKGEGNKAFAYMDGRIKLWDAEPGIKTEHYNLPSDIYVGRVGKDKISIRPRGWRIERYEPKQLEQLYKKLSSQYPDHQIIYFPWSKAPIPVEVWLKSEQTAEDFEDKKKKPNEHEEMDKINQNTDDVSKMYTSIGHVGDALLWWFKDGKLIIRPITHELSKHPDYYAEEKYEENPKHQGRVALDKHKISFSSIEHNLPLERKIVDALKEKYPDFDIIYFGPTVEERAIPIDQYLYQQQAKDFEEKEHDWSEVLIDKDKKLTRGQIRDHYNKVKSKLFPYVKNRKVIVYIGTGTNQNVLKRNENDKPIIIKSIEGDTPSALDYWIKRRMIEIHPTVSSQDDVVWVDLDLHGDYSLSEAKKYADKIVPIIKKEFGGKVEKWFSGSTGIHVVGYLKEKVDIDKARNTLKFEMDKLAEGDEKVTTGIVKGNGLRLDTTTLKNTGSIRAPYSLALNTGNEKKQLGSAKEASISKRAQDYLSIGHFGSDVSFWWFKDNKVFIRNKTKDLVSHIDFYNKFRHNEEDVKYRGRVDHNAKKISFYSKDPNIKIEKKIADILFGKYPGYNIVYFGEGHFSGIDIDKYFYDSQTTDKEAKMLSKRMKHKPISKRAGGRGKGDPALSGWGMEWPDDPHAFYWKDRSGEYGDRNAQVIVRTRFADPIDAPVLMEEHFVGNGLENLRAQVAKYLQTIIFWSFHETKKTLNVSLVEKRIKQIPIKDEKGETIDYRAEEEEFDSYKHRVYIQIIGDRRRLKLFIGENNKPITIEGEDSALNVARRFLERAMHSLTPVRG